MNLTKDEIQAALDEEISFMEKEYGKKIKLKLINIIGLIKMINPTDEQKKSRLIPLSKWNDYHDYPSVGALRQYYYRKDTNNFEYCIVNGGDNGTRLLINEDKFFDWLNTRKNQIAS